MRDTNTNTATTYASYINETRILSPFPVLSFNNSQALLLTHMAFLVLPHHRLQTLLETSHNGGDAV
jgi:hypothetical protein